MRMSSPGSEVRNPAGRHKKRGGAQDAMHRTSLALQMFINR
jgi:hypothetical protein